MDNIRQRFVDAVDELGSHRVEAAAALVSCPCNCCTFTLHIEAGLLVGRCVACSLQAFECPYKQAEPGAF